MVDISFTGQLYVNSLAVSNGKIYSLRHKNPTLISVQHLSGTLNLDLGASWSHPYSFYFGQRMVVTGDNQLAVGDWQSKQIIIYSLTGQVIRRLGCPHTLTMTANMCMSSCGAGCVVISDCKAGKVVKMSLKDGAVLWSVKGVASAGGMVHHPAGLVLVARSLTDCTTIVVLDAKDGWYTIIYMYQILNLRKSCNIE